MLHTTTSSRRGFTLLELLVVLAIIGLISSVGVSSLTEARKKSRNAVRLQEVTAYSKAAEIYYVNNQKYPQGYSSYRCLGTQSGVDCPFGSGVVAGDSGIYALFEGVMNGKPPASPEAGVSPFTGYHYACVSGGGCPGYYIRYMLEGDNQQCASNSLTINPSYTHALLGGANGTKLTYCQVVVCPLGMSPNRTSATAAYTCS